MPENDDIKYQTESILNTLKQNTNSTQTYQAKTNYQMEMYTSLKYVNELFLLFYIVLFTAVHGLFLQQYLMGVKRDEVQDTIWLTFFFLYPYLIYYLEKTIYFGITYVLALIYGQTYVYGFDQLLLFNDYYADSKWVQSSQLSEVKTGY
jgi:hypothetical protein